MIYRTELSTVLPFNTITTIILDPTQIKSDALGLSAKQQDDAILAYSRSPFAPIDESLDQAPLVLSQSPTFAD